MESTLDLQVLTPVDWPLLKAARLDALQDSPDAFMSRYELEWTWDESEWRRSIETTTWIVAREEERVVGLARSVVEPRQPWARFLESIWVDPARRRNGVFRALLHKLAEVERHLGVTELLLWVLDDNHTARHAYEAAGFTPTGKRQFLPEIARFEVQLKLTIRRSPSV
jgi:GNAT superfamily N-acetyltransferase